MKELIEVDTGRIGGKDQWKGKLKVEVGKKYKRYKKLKRKHVNVTVTKIQEIEGGAIILYCVEEVV